MRWKSCKSWRRGTILNLCNITTLRTYALSDIPTANDEFDREEQHNDRPLKFPEAVVSYFRAESIKDIKKE